MTVLKHGDRFELLHSAALVAAISKKTVYQYPAGTRGFILLAQPKHLHGSALVELEPRPTNGAPWKYFVRYADMLLTDPRPETAA